MLGLGSFGKEMFDFFTPDSSLIDMGKVYAKQYLTNKLKEAFGKEFFLFEKFDTKHVNSDPLMKFLSRIIDNFEEKYIDSTGGVKPIIFEKIDKNTFIYIASDIFVPNKAFSNAVRKGDRGDYNSIYDANIYIYIFGKKSPKYINKLNDVLKEAELLQQKKKIAIISDMSYDSTDISTISFDPRDINSLVYSENEMGIIQNHLDKFIENCDFYKRKQLLYKTGILLYGVPGTGKSTICKVLANMYQRNIVQINIPTIDKINFAELTRLINNDEYKYIILLEDIDTLYLNREEEQKDKDYNNIINNLLQFLDSNTSPNNVIFIATTNHIDRLDEALLRAGRFDLKIEIKGIPEKDIDRMLDLFNLDHSLKKEVVTEYKKIYKQEHGKEHHGLYIQSDLQTIMLQKIKNDNILEL